MGLKRKASDAFVYNLMSDGELGEGSTWEAAMSAVQHELDNIICMVDFNNQQADGKVTDALARVPEENKWQAFGWHTQRVNGNDLDAVVHALDAARSTAHRGPRIIIFDTRMCQGVDFLAEREVTHFVRVDPQEWDMALQALAQGKPA
jgi:transketolase